MSPVGTAALAASDPKVGSETSDASESEAARRLSDRRRSPTYSPKAKPRTGSGRGALCTGRSHTERSGGLCTRENAGMSSERHARNMPVESLRFPGEGSSAQG